MTKPLIYLIKLYQKTLSPDHGPLNVYHPAGFCRHYPSCSQYAIIALNAHGLITGSVLAFKRMLRCNPLVRPKLDLSCYKNYQKAEVS